MELNVSAAGAGERLSDRQPRHWLAGTRERSRLKPDQLYDQLHADILEGRIEDGAELSLKMAMARTRGRRGSARVPWRD